MGAGGERASQDKSFLQTADTRALSRREGSAAITTAREHPAVVCTASSASQDDHTLVLLTLDMIAGDDSRSRGTHAATPGT